jgi:hypothetical protein
MKVSEKFSLGGPRRIFQFISGKEVHGSRNGV